jgi:hypothetical protein
MVLTCGNRSFEYLGATASYAVTPGPGKRSFTRALIWALKDLGKGSDPPNLFTTTQLVRRIREAPDFCRRQVPTLNSRESTSCQRLILCPLPSTKQQNDDAVKSPTKSTTEILKLNFHFESASGDTELRALANILVRHITTTQRGSLHRVTFGGIIGVKSAVHNAIDIWRRRSGSAIINPISTISLLRPESEPDIHQQQPSPISEQQSARLTENKIKAIALEKGVWFHFNMFWIALLTLFASWLSSLIRLGGVRGEMRRQFTKNVSALSLLLFPGMFIAVSGIMFFDQMTEH